MSWHKPVMIGINNERINWNKLISCNQHIINVDICRLILAMEILSLTLFFSKLLREYE